MEFNNLDLVEDISRVTNLSPKDLNDLNLPLLEDYNIRLHFEDCPSRGDYYEVYMIKKDNLIISYAILSYYKDGVRNPYDSTHIFTDNIKWYVH